MTLKEYVRNYYEENQEILTTEEELYEPLMVLITKDRPQTNTGEPVDFENFEVLEMTDDKIIVCSGGDWQDPTKFEMTLVDEKIKINVIDYTFEEGMDDIIFLSELFGIINSVYDDWYYLAINLFDVTN